MVVGSIILIFWVSSINGRVIRFVSSVDVLNFMVMIFSVNSENKEMLSSLLVRC